jgi:hypothetical protein
MAEHCYTIRDPHGNLLEVDLKRDKRLKKSSRWERLPNGRLLIRVPFRFPRYMVSSLLEQVASQLDQPRAFRMQRTDADLQQRAEQINREHFNGKMKWNAIRWVGNMNSRLGSCTGGGTTDGQIRISDKIKNWPEWVVDYVIAHELMHRKHPNHSAAFWNDLKAAYPLTERARGFIHGMDFASQRPSEEDW